MKSIPLALLFAASCSAADTSQFREAPAFFHGTCEIRWARPDGSFGPPATYTCRSQDLEHPEYEERWRVLLQRRPGQAAPRPWRLLAVNVIGAEMFSVASPHCPAV